MLMSWCEGLTKRCKTNNNESFQLLSVFLSCLLTSQIPLCTSSGLGLGFVSIITINYLFQILLYVYALQVLGHLSPSDVPGPRWSHVGHQDPTVSILNITFYAFSRDLLTLINFVNFKGTFFNPWTTTANITKTSPQIASVFGVSLKSWKCQKSVRHYPFTNYLEEYDLWCDCHNYCRCSKLLSISI